MRTEQSEGKGRPMNKQSKKKTKTTINLNELKFRREWGMNPCQRPHTDKNGKRGYKRSDNRNAEREALGN